MSETSESYLARRLEAVKDERDEAERELAIAQQTIDGLAEAVCPCCGEYYDDHTPGKTENAALEARIAELEGLTKVIAKLYKGGGRESGAAPKRKKEALRAPMIKSDRGAHDETHEEYHGWHGEPCGCKGGGRKEAKA